MDKYTVVVKQKRSWFRWVRDNNMSPFFHRNHIAAVEDCNKRNFQHHTDCIKKPASLGRFRWIIISIDDV